MSNEQSEGKFVNAADFLSEREYNKIFHPELVKPLLKKAKIMTSEEVNRRNAAADRLCQRRNGDLEFSLSERQIELIKKWKATVDAEIAEDTRRFLINRGVNPDRIGKEDEDETD